MRRYDLILFALPDSLTLVAGQSSVRLESYLFTREAIEAAREHLSPRGRLLDVQLLPGGLARRSPRRHAGVGLRPLPVRRLDPARLAGRPCSPSA